MYYALDHLGSIAAIVVSNGTGRTLRSYDNWGKQRFPSGADDTANTLWSQNAEVRGFIGQEQVAQIGLVNLNARMYDPWLGRFLQVDPIIGSIYNLQGLNPYSYVMNNPLTDSDPFGLCGLLSCPGKAIGSFFSHAFAGPAGNVLKAVIVIAAVATFQYEVLPALVGPVVIGAEEGSVVLTGLSALAYTSPLAAAAEVAAVGAVGGAINTGTLRGALIGAVTAEAFWGVGGLKVDIANSIQGVSGAGAINVAAGVALHAAVGCASSAAAGGGRCGSGALSAGLGELTTSYINTLNTNPYVKGAIVGLGGGTGAALTGGRFGDGFFIAASGYVFNQGLHPPVPDLNGQPWVPYDQLPTQSQYILQNRSIDLDTGQIILTTPSNYQLVPAPTGGGSLLVPADWQPGDRQNVIRIQPYGTGSSVRWNYTNGYYIVYNQAGAAVSIYSGQQFRDNAPQVHNPIGRVIPNIGTILGN